MPLLTIVLLAAAASSDSFIIGFNYGVKGVLIGKVSNGFLSLTCFCGTLLSMLLGRGMGAFLDPQWAVFAGGALFAVLGGFMLVSALGKAPCQTRHYSENPQIVDKDASKIIELRESLVIGLLLCLNNVGIGVGGGMAGIPILLLPLACAAASYGLIWLGCSLGARIINPRLSRTLEILSAAFILCLGLWECLQLPV